MLRVHLAMLHALVVTAAIAAPVAVGGAHASEDDAQAWIARGDSLRALREFDATLNAYDEAQSRLLALGDTARIRVLENERLAVLLRSGNARACLDGAEDLIVRTRADGDSLTLSQALYWKARSYDTLGRDRRAIPTYEELIALASAIGDSTRWGQAESYLARWSRQDGDLDVAAERIAHSNAIFEAIGDGHRLALNLLLEGLIAVGRDRPEDARECWQKGVEAAKEFHNPSIYINCINNIAVMEATTGDPAVAMECWEEARRVALERQRWRSSIRPTINLAWMLATLGKRTEAVSMLEDARILAREKEFTDLEGEIVLQIAGIAQRRNEFARSAQLFREALTILVDRGDVDDRFMVRRGLALSLVELDSMAAARDQLEAIEVQRDLLIPLQDLELDVALATLANREGRFERALERVDSGLRRTRGGEWKRTELRLFEEQANAYEGLDAPDSTIAALERARRLYEGIREIPTDATWREQRSEYAYRVYPRLAWLRWREKGESPEAIHALLQPYKARTLLERIMRPGDSAAGEATARVGLRTLREEVLRDGELFLDLYAGPVHSLLFAITTQRCVLMEVPGVDAMHDRIVGFSELLRGTDPNANDAALLEGAARSLFDELFREALAVAPDARRILFSPDGVFTPIPLDYLLVASGQRSTTEIQRVPSTQILATLRSRTDAEESSAVGILALLPRDASTELPGAVEEVHRLERQFDAVEVRILGEGADPVADAGWSKHAVVHVASHARLVDADPWRSAILFDARDGAEPNTGQERSGTVGQRPRQLRALDIAAMDLDARLVVLSGCETLGGEMFAGAGVLGLSSAFLVAGADQVLATLWRVDDRVTSRFMRHFYDAIAAGRSATQALSVAQDRVRSHPATAHPFYWAGFVLVGDDAASLPVHASTGGGQGFRWLLAVVLLVGLGLLAVRIRRSA